ncbi:hypothetical protein C1645_839614 [Glomus cerebriforme]|uniref:SAM domain-containing protein n=1 Tax=Glomus cerebriforme TaxID=658196 RepID=A0A397S0C7_9GLOM|nr:hypothetical protein C1645_839614 [Glomus cerebriforme]
MDGTLESTTPSKPKRTSQKKSSKSKVVSTDDVESTEVVQSKPKRKSLKVSTDSVENTPSKPKKTSQRKSSKSSKTTDVDISAEGTTVPEKADEKTSLLLKDSMDGIQTTEVIQPASVVTVEEIMKWNRADVIKYLENKKELDLDKYDIEIIRKNGKFTGRIFLNLSYNELKSIGLAIGPAKEIADLIRKLMNKDQAVQKRIYEEPESTDVFNKKVKLLQRASKSDSNEDEDKMSEDEVLYICHSDK